MGGVLVPGPGEKMSGKILGWLKCIVGLRWWVG